MKTYANLFFREDSVQVCKPVVLIRGQFEDEVVKMLAIVTVWEVHVEVIRVLVYVEKHAAVVPFV